VIDFTFSFGCYPHVTAASRVRQPAPTLPAGCALPAQCGSVQNINLEEAVTLILYPQCFHVLSIMNEVNEWNLFCLPLCRFSALSLLCQLVRRGRLLVLAILLLTQPRRLRSETQERSKQYSVGRRKLCFAAETQISSSYLRSASALFAATRELNEFIVPCRRVHSSSSSKYPERSSSRVVVW
jgi:hypothetical protein